MERDSAIITSIQKQKNFFSPISQPKQLGEELGSLETPYYSVEDDLLGGPVRVKEFLNYQIFPQLLSPYKASD